MVSSFLLHVQPAKVGRHALRRPTTLGLGLISLYLFLILTGTGVLLMFYYVPSTTQAYDRDEGPAVRGVRRAWSCATCTAGRRT